MIGSFDNDTYNCGPLVYEFLYCDAVEKNICKSFLVRLSVC